MKKLAVIAAAGLAVAAVCAVAAAVMGVDMIGDGIDLPLFGRDACADTGATATRRSLAWDGGDAVTIAIPATVRYRPGGGDRLEVSGDPLVLSHLRVRDGRIDMDCDLPVAHPQM